MGDYRRTIHADQAGILDMLEEKRLYEWERGHPPPTHKTTQKDRARHTGMAEGLQWAMDVIRDWQEAADIELLEEESSIHHHVGVKE